MQPTGTECRTIAITRFSPITSLSAEKNQQARKEFFEMNDSVRIKEMNFFWLLKRG